MHVVVVVMVVAVSREKKAGVFVCAIVQPRSHFCRALLFACACVASRVW